MHFSPRSEFKPGCLEGSALKRWRPAGSVSVRVHRRRRSRWVKVREDGPRWKRWKPLARYLYEWQIGPVPAGWVVVHRNGDSMDDRLDNYMILPRRELPAWERTIRPRMEERRRARAGAVNALRGRIWRARKERRRNGEEETNARERSCRAVSALS